MAVYSHQKAEFLECDKSDYLLYTPEEVETGALVPITPLIETLENNILEKTIMRISDSLLIERIRLEFAGLCNQIFSADGERFTDIDVLRRVCKKAGGYINIGLELLSRGDVEISEAYIRNHPLITIFQVGFGRALELKWKAERWVKKSWFNNRELETDFWGEEWGGALKGMIRNKPLFFSGMKEEDEYRDFESLSELESGEKTLRRIRILDSLIARLTSHYPIMII